MPMATPLTAATRGFCRRDSACRKSRARVSKPPPAVLRKSVMSLPAVNVPPDPAIIRQRIASLWSASLSARVISAYIASVSAFFFSGRLKRTIRMASSSVTVTVALVILPPCEFVKAQCRRPDALIGTFMVVADEPADCPEFAACRGARLRLDGAVEPDHALADWRDGSPAAARAAGFGGYGRFAQRLVDFLHQEPRPPVGHADRSGRGGDRAGRLNRLQKRDLAWADAASGRKIDADGEVCAGHGRPLVHDPQACPGLIRVGKPVFGNDHAPMQHPGH